MKKQLLILLFLYSSSAIAAAPNSFLLGGQFGFQFEEPTEFNRYIDQTNSVLNTKIPHLSKASSINVHVGYQINENFALLLNYTRFSPWVSGTMGSTTLKASTETNIFMFDTRYNLLSSTLAIPYIKFGIGYAHYTVEEFVNSNSDSGSASSLAIKLGAGGEFPLSDFFSLSLEGGYLFAKSGTLRDSDGESYGPGILNMSGVYVLAGFDFIIPFSTSRSEP